MTGRAESLAENSPVSAKQPIAVVPAAYNSLVAAARLRDIRLLKSEFSLEPEGIGSEESWKLHHACEIQQASFDADRQLLYAFVDASAFCKIKNKRIVTIKCRYMILYQVHGAPAEAEVDAFANRVARFTAYPYFRAHVAEVSSQAGLLLPPLPIIKETKVIPKIDAAKHAESLSKEGKEEPK